MHPAPGPRPLTPVEAARGFFVVFAGPILLALAALAGAVSSARSLLRLRPPSTPALAALLGAVVYARIGRPRLLRWGSQPSDGERALPGDELLPAPGGTEILHAVTIEAPPGDVWPWLAQIGQDRGGFYSYEWLENLAGCEMRNAEAIHPEWQHRDLGEVVLLHPGHGLAVNLFEPGRAIGLENWGNFVLEPLGGRTRLFARGRIPPGLASASYALLFEIPHFVMQRRMLLGIKERAEASASA